MFLLLRPWSAPSLPRVGALLGSLALLAATAGAADPVLRMDYESGVAGAAPPASSVSPTSPVGATTPLPVTPSTTGPRGVAVGPYTGMPAAPVPGTGKFVRFFDYDTDTGTVLRYDFAANAAEMATAVRVAFAFAATANHGTDAKTLRFSAGQLGMTLASSANRPMLLTLATNGALRLDLSGSANDLNVTFTPAEAHQVVLYLNDHDSETLEYAGPDGVARTLAANSVALFLDAVYRGVGPFDNTLSYRTAPSNLGQIEFNTTTSDAYIDFLLDDVQVDVLRGTVAAPAPTVPAGFGTGTLAAVNLRYDPAVLLWERFPYGTGELRSNSSARWSVGDGAPSLQVADDALVFDYTTPATNAGVYRRNFSGDRQYHRAPTAGQLGPVSYRAFTITVRAAPAPGASGWFQALQGIANATTFNGHVWLRAGATSGTAQLGVSTDAMAATAVFAARDLVPGTPYRVVVRHDAATNDSALWIDAAEEAEPADAVAAKTGDMGTYTFSGVALRVLNTDGTNLGRFDVDDLRVATDFAAALATTPVVAPVAEVRRNGSNFSITTDAFDAYLTGNHQLAYLRHGGLFWLGPEGGAFTASGTTAVQNASTVGSFFYKTFMLREMTAGGFARGRYVVMLQNHDNTATATYRLSIDATVATQVRTGDGATAATPVAVTGAAAGDVVLRHESGRVLRLTGFERMTSGPDGVPPARQFLLLDVPPRSVRSFMVTFDPLSVDAPQDWQVFQRATRTGGPVRVAGRAPAGAEQVTVEFSAGDLRAPPLAGALPAGEQAVAFEAATLKFAQEFTLPAGGWYRATVRARAAGAVIAEWTVERFGVGEVFLAAGQSNSTNSAYANSDLTVTEGPMNPASGLVSSFSGAHWQEGHDPQPGAHDTSSGGSYYPAFGDQLAARFGVPVAISIAGQGATDVAEWQPAAPHDFTDFAGAYHNGLYNWLLARARQFGPGGFRALLWHQGESDSTHVPGTTRTSRQDYYNRLANVIVSSRADAGWAFPWFVARASRWPLETTGDPNVQQAQEQLWSEGLAWRGADSDSLGLAYRDLGGSRVHFATPHGLLAHAALWSEIVGDSLDVVFRGTGAADSDGGGAADYWERLHGFDPLTENDDAADADGDGDSNRMEFLTGGDPFDASDRFVVQPALVTVGGWQIGYRARAGHTYVLERSTTLAAGSWTEVERRTAASDDENAVFTATLHAGEPAAFFRIGVTR